MREKSKHKLLHYLQSSAFILMSDDACVSVSVWFDIDVALLCVERWFQRSQCNCVCCLCCMCACSVSATPLNSRSMWHVATHLCFVMFQSPVFVQFFQFIQFHSFRDFWRLRCNPATSIKTQSNSQSPTSGQEGRSSVQLVWRPPRNHLSISGRGGWWHLGNTCLFILFLAGERLIRF